ncbi:MAG: hypothetical protein ACYS1A_03615 [Planctomycetota bacterium]|jgi:hypothetical protein
MQSKTIFCLLGLLVIAGCGLTESPSERTDLFFREDFKETPPVTPVTQEHVANPQLLLSRHGPAKDLIKKSNHAPIPNDPWYIWSGMCDGNWALTLAKKGALVDLSANGQIRWRTKQAGPNVLKVVLGTDDGKWLVSEQGFGETPDWHEFSADIAILKWRSLDINTIEAGKRIGQPDLRKVRSVGWTDLTRGGASSACTRVDWIEVYGKEIVK